MISNFAEQYFGGNKNWVNAKFKLLLNHSNLIHNRAGKDRNGMHLKTNLI